MAMTGLVSPNTLLKFPVIVAPKAPLILEADK